MRLRNIAANDYLEITRRRAGLLTRLISRSTNDVNLTSNEDRLTRYLTRRSYLGACRIVARITLSFLLEDRNDCEIGCRSVCNDETSRLVNGLRYLLAVI